MKTQHANHAHISTLRDSIRANNHSLINTPDLKLAAHTLWQDLSARLRNDRFDVDLRKLIPNLPEDGLSEHQKLFADKSLKTNSQNREIKLGRKNEYRDSPGTKLFKTIAERAASSVGYKDLSKTQKGALISRLTSFFNDRDFSFQHNGAALTDKEAIRKKVSTYLTEIHQPNSRMKKLKASLKGQSQPIPSVASIQSDAGHSLHSSASSDKKPAATMPRFEQADIQSIPSNHLSFQGEAGMDDQSFTELDSVDLNQKLASRSTNSIPKTITIPKKEEHPTSDKQNSN